METRKLYYEDHFQKGFATTRYNSKVTIIGLTLLDSEMADMTVSSAHREQPETGANYTV